MNEPTAAAPTAENVSAVIGEIILASRQIETLLHKITGSDAAGIHALTEAANDKLSGELKRQLHYIGAVRNQAAHEAEMVFTDDEMNRFRQTASAVQAALEKLLPAEEPAAEANFSEQPAENAPEEESSELAVEKEFFESVSQKIMLLGIFPFVGIIQQLFLLLSAMLKQIWVVLLTVLYACSVVLLVGGFKGTAEHGLLYVGAGLFVFSHICVTVMAFMEPILKSSIKWLWLIPVVNMFYLPLRWLRDLQWSKVAMSLGGLGCFTAAVLLVLKGYYPWAFFALLGSWAFSAVSFLIWKKKSEK